MFAPVIPGYLVGKDLKVSAMFLGKTKVVYHLAGSMIFIRAIMRLRKLRFHTATEAGCTAGAVSREMRPA